MRIRASAVSGRSNGGRLTLCVLLASVLIQWLALGSEVWAFPVSPAALTYTASQTSPMPAAQTIAFSKRSFRPRPWTSSSNASWMTISPSSGTIAREQDQITVQVNASGLAAGTHNGNVSIAVEDKGGRVDVVTVPVTFVVTGGTSTSSPSIQLNPTSLSFSATVGGSTPLAKSINLTNPTGGTLTWSMTESAPWLGLNVASGTTTTEVDSVSASVAISGLAAGTYSTAITVSASGATNSPRTIPVTLTVTAPTTNGAAVLSWLPNTEPDLAGYKIYVGTQPGVYSAPISVGPVATYTVGSLTSGRTYYFSMTAVDQSGNESARSPEVSKPIL